MHSAIRFAPNNRALGVFSWRLAYGVIRSNDRDSRGERDWLHCARGMFVIAGTRAGKDEQRWRADRTGVGTRAALTSGAQARESREGRR